MIVISSSNFTEKGSYCETNRQSVYKGSWVAIYQLNINQEAAVSCT